MEERQVTVDGQTIALPRPFFVVATQNPIDDVKYLAPFVLIHRLTLTEKDLLRGTLPESFLERIIEQTPVPV